MFRAQAAGPFDDVVAKATDENLTSEDWAAIIEVCDKVTGDASGPKEAAQSMIKRLAHRNANVQLYTLELAHAVCQNCGKPMHREISSRAFTDALLKLANDRNTHNQVKAKILQKMKEWTDMFSNDADLGIMGDAYQRLKHTNPTLHPPSAPQKQGLTDADRQKEDEELQMALKLSLQEEERKKTASQPASSGAQAGPSSRPQQDSAPGSTSASASSPAPAVPAGTTAATVSRVRALYDFVPSEAGELEFKRGDVIAVLESVYKDWWRGSLKGNTGIFPLNYVEKLTDPTPDELQREAQMEAEVFAEIKNVEKLLTLLSASNVAPRDEDNEEISKLYHQTLAIRPKLIKLIEKYSQKKDDFTQLNEKFIKARRDYEALLESSMSHPPQHNYQQYPLRPAPQGHQGYAGGGYVPGQAPQEAYYNQGPPSDHHHYQPSSPPPNVNFQPQTHQSQGVPSPFYSPGSEMPSHGPVPQQQQQPHQQQYPPRDDTPGMTSQAGKQPASVHPSSPSPYSHLPPQQQQQHSQGTYGAQELATSVYDAPIAPQNVPTSGAAFGQQYQGFRPEQPSRTPPVPQGGGVGAAAYPGVVSAGADGSHQPSQPSQPSQSSQPQYKPYVPPGAVEGSSSADDYYR
ncbi:ESCRT-0 subunit protein hse1 [Claviceps purpurea]|nr:ESCRT-0 subunit protein hse1 [Claviceps purpurea]